MKTRTDRAVDAVLREELQALHRCMDQGLKDKDLPASMASRSPDFVSEELDGTTSSREMTHVSFQRLIETGRSVPELDVHVDRVTLQGDAAIAAVTGRFAGRLADPENQEHDAVRQWTARETWRQTADGWKLQRSVILSRETTVDGQPVEGRALDEAARQELQAVYDRRARAFRDNDLPAHAAILAPDYSATTLDGRTLNGEQDQAAWQRRRDTLTAITESRSVVERVVVSGEHAVVTVTNHLACDAVDPRNEVRAVVHREWHRETRNLATPAAESHSRISLPASPGA
jgi:ketosteroid isomerase-like protein